MTKNIVSILSLLLAGLCAEAQTFETMLKDAFMKFEYTDSLQRKISAANRLDLIAARYSDQWIAHYYAAYAKVVTAYMLTDEAQRDMQIDQAEQSLSKCKSLTTTGDELLILEAYIANARLAVKPMSRHKKYGAIFDARLDEAMALNPANPRIYFLKGQSLFHTPRAFGGGAKNALPYLEKAAALFGKESKDDVRKPHWGQQKNDYYIGECKK